MKGSELLRTLAIGAAQPPKGEGQGLNFTDACVPITRAEALELLRIAEQRDTLPTALSKLEILRDKNQRAHGDITEYKAFDEICVLLENALK